MLNTKEAYAEIGRKAAIARNQHDEARAQFHASHFRSMKGLEKPEDRPTVDRIYQNAYQEARNV